MPSSKTTSQELYMKERIERYNKWLPMVAKDIEKTLTIKIKLFGTTPISDSLIEITPTP